MTNHALSCRHASPRTPLLCFCRHGVCKGEGGELVLAFQHLPGLGPFLYPLPVLLLFCLYHGWWGWRDTKVDSQLTPQLTLLASLVRDSRPCCIYFLVRDWRHERQRKTKVRQASLLSLLAVCLGDLSSSLFFFCSHPLPHGLSYCHMVLNAGLQEQGFQFYPPCSPLANLRIVLVFCLPLSVLSPSYAL